MLVTIYLPQLRVCEAICHPGVELNSSPHYTHMNVQHMHPFHLLAALRVRPAMIMTISHTCKSYPYDDHYQGYSSQGQHYVSRNFVSLCTYSVTCKTPPPSEQEENLQMPFVHHGFNGKTLITLQRLTWRQVLTLVFG